MPPIKLVVVAFLACGAVFLTLVINTTSCGHRSPTTFTRILVYNVRAIATEYEVRADKVPPGSHVSAEASMTAFLDTVNKEDIPRQMLLNLGRDYITLDADGKVIGINDAWGRSLWYVPYNDGQTNRLPARGSEDAVHPIVISAGQDGMWGTYEGTRPDANAADNLDTHQE